MPKSSKHLTHTLLFGLVFSIFLMLGWAGDSFGQWPHQAQEMMERQEEAPGSESAANFGLRPCETQH